MRFVTSVFAALLAANASAAMEVGQHRFDLDGYFRSSAGMAENGDTQVDFKAPGARSKYRLGNEADTNLELAIDHRYLMTGSVDGPSVQTYFMLDGYAEHEQAFEFGGLQQAYVSFHDFFGSGSAVWAGKRYYDRQDVHINDHVWLDPGVGAELGMGIEGVKVGPGELAFAVFRYRDEGGNLILPATEQGQEPTVLTGTVNSTALDLRIRNISLLNGDHSLNLWGQLMQRHENDELDYRNKMGFGAGAWIESKNLLGGEHTLTGLLFTGPAITKGDYDATPVREDDDYGYDLDEAVVIELSSNYYKEVDRRYAFETLLLMRHETRGIESGVDGDIIIWLSAGGRFVRYLSDYLSIAVEAGVDNVTNEIVDTTGNLLKGTVALQVAQKPGYFQRPVLRLFVTMASWQDDFKGQVGGGAYAEDTAGYTVGAQVETWW